MRTNQTWNGVVFDLGELSSALMPADPRGRSEAVEWVFAALNSVEMASLPWSIFKFTGDTGDTPASKHLDEFLKARLKHMEPVLAGREWLAGSFSVADILMADVLRLVDRFDGLAGHPACRDYVARATAARRAAHAVGCRRYRGKSSRAVALASGLCGRVRAVCEGGIAGRHRERRTVGWVSTTESDGRSHLG